MVFCDSATRSHSHWSSLRFIASTHNSTHYPALSYLLLPHLCQSHHDTASKDHAIAFPSPDSLTDLPPESQHDSFHDLDFLLLALLMDSA